MISKTKRTKLADLEAKVAALEAELADLEKRQNAIRVQQNIKSFRSLPLAVRSALLQRGIYPAGMIIDNKNDNRVERR